MKIQTCDSVNLVTYTDINDEKSINSMLTSIFIYEDTYRVIELTFEEEEKLNDIYRQNIGDDEMPTDISWWLLDLDSDSWYMFKSSFRSFDLITLTEFENQIKTEQAYLEAVYQKIGREI